MTRAPAEKARELIEGILRGFFEQLTPEEAALEGVKLIGIISGNMRGQLNAEQLANLFWNMGDNIVALETPPAPPSPPGQSR